MHDMVSFKWDNNRTREIATEEGFKKGFAEGRAIIFEESTIRLLKKSYPIRDIADVTNLSIEEIKKIAKEHGLTY